MSFIGDPWLRMQGIRRITAEFRYMSNLIMKGRLPQLSDLHLPNDNIFQWRVHVSGFDEEQAPAGSGAAVNRDLQKLQSSCGQGFMLLELLFPEDDKYPTAPFFLRVVTPRCRMYTGHVTAGGSICIKALVQGPAADGCWQPSFSVESMLQLVLTNMIDCEVGTTQTAQGGIAATGPLRIDLGGNPMQEYSKAEADAAFRRTAATHGWSFSSNSRQQLHATPQQAPLTIAPLFGAQSPNMQQPMQAANRLQAAPPSSRTTLPQPLAQPSLSVPPHAVQAVQAAQAAQAVQAVQSTPLSAPMQLSRSSLQTSSHTLPATVLTTVLPPTAAQPAASALAHHSSSHLTTSSQQAQTGSRKRARQDGLSSTSLSSQLQPPAAAQTAVATAVATVTIASTGLLSVVSPLSAGPPATTFTFQPQKAVTVFSVVDKTKTQRGSSSKAMPAKLVWAQDGTGKNTSTKASSCTATGGSSSGNVHVSAISLLPFAGSTPAASDHNAAISLSSGSHDDAEGGAPRQFSPKAVAAPLNSAAKRRKTQAEEERGKLVSAEKQIAELQRQLKQNNKNQHAQKNVDVIRTAKIPGNWEPWDNYYKQKTVQYAVLPLPAGCAKSLSSTKPYVSFEHHHWAETIVNEGRSIEDAEAAVRHCPSSLHHAAAWVNEQQVPHKSCTGIDPRRMTLILPACRLNFTVGLTTGHVLQREEPQLLNETTWVSQDENYPGFPGGVVKKAECMNSVARGSALRDITAKKAKLLTETEVVLVRLEQETGVLRGTVAGIERVQNHGLLTKFMIRRCEVLQSVGGVLASLNEHRMWHGCSLCSIHPICLNGFDMRVSNRNGLLGEGNYFANSSTYSLPYSAQKISRVASSPVAAHGQRTHTLAPASTEVHACMGSKAMMMCRVVFGRIYQCLTGATLRKPPDGFDSVGTSTRVPGSGNTFFAVFDNAQAIPEYIVHLT